MIQGRTLVTAATMETVVMVAMVVMVVTVAMVVMPGAEVRMIAKNVNIEQYYDSMIFNPGIAFVIKVPGHWSY